MDNLNCSQLALPTYILDYMLVVWALNHQYAFASHRLSHLDLVARNDIHFLFPEDGRCGIAIFFSEPNQDAILWALSRGTLKGANAIPAVRSCKNLNI